MDDGGVRGRHGRASAGPLAQVTLDAELREDLSWPWAWAIFWLPMSSLAVIVAVDRADPRTFTWLTAEDRPLEWLQFAACLFTGLLALAAAARLTRRLKLPAALLLVVLGLGALLAAAAEITWAQRVIRGAGELTGLRLRDLQSIPAGNQVPAGFPLERVVDVAEIVVCLVAVAIAQLARGRRARVRIRLVRLLAPPLFTVPLFAAMPVYRVAAWLVDVPGRPELVPGLESWAELCLYLGIALLVLAAHRRAHRRPLERERLIVHARRRDSRAPARLASAAVVVTVACAVLSALPGVVAS